MKKYDVEKRHDHELIRNKAAIFDFTHGRIQISGADACSFLEGICTNYISNVKNGRIRYTAILNENGYYTDDIVF